MTSNLILPNGQKANFRLACDARDAGSLRVVADHISFVIAQRVRFEHEERLWESIQLHCEKEPDESLTVQVLLYDPKLEGGVQIAFLRSRPDDVSRNDESLECDLNPTKFE